MIEHTLGNGSAHMFKVEETIFSTKSEYQKIDIVKLSGYGKTLFLDCKLQSSAVDDPVYHETLVQPAMFLHEKPENVLIIGGGEGATLREALKHNGNVTMVELDQKLAELCMQYMPEWSQGSFQNPRSKIIYGDGKAYLENVSEKFDVIISDLTAPSTGSYPLFTKQFFTTVQQHLKKDGIFALQADSTNCIDRKTFTEIYNTVKNVFKCVKPYHTYIPSYDTSWGFILASDKQYGDVVKEKNVETKFYDPEIHKSLFCLSKDLRLDMSKETTVYEDK